MDDSNFRILLVDDFPENIQLIASLLKAQPENYMITFAGGGREALERIASTPIDLVLLDVMMPDMDGFTVCSEIRKQNLDIPVIFVTALGDKQSIIKGIEVGGDDFITKPIDADILKTRVKNICQLNRYRKFNFERKKLDWVIENSNDGYLIIDKTDTVSYANQKALDYIGISKKMLPFNFYSEITKQYQIIFENNDFTNNWSKAKETCSRFLFLRPETSLSKSFWLQANLLKSKLNEDSYFIKLTDVTDNINKVFNMWSFNSAVSHKLRTPLAGVIGIIDLLNSDYLKLSPGELKDYIYLITSGIKKLYSQLDEMLKFVDSKKILDCSGTTTPDNILAIINKFKKMENISSVVISGVETFSENIQVKANNEMIELIFAELFDNSIKFHPKNYPDIKIKFILENKALKICFCDDGVNLSPEQLDKILLPFYQAEKYNTGEIDGLGLGLSMIEMLMKKVNGSVKIYNRLDDQTGICTELSFAVE